MWKAYGIGCGKLLKLQYPSASELPTLTATQTHSSTFTSIKARRTNARPQFHGDEVERVTVTEENLTRAEEALFACSEEGYMRTFLRHSSMQRHLDCGKHERALERETLTDRAIKAYAERLRRARPLQYQRWLQTQDLNIHVIPA